MFLLTSYDDQPKKLLLFIRFYKAWLVGASCWFSEFNGLWMSCGRDISIFHEGISLLNDTKWLYT